MYTNGDYLKNNPTWDVEDAPWKADLIFRMIQKHHIEPKTICEIGCGCGEILRQLQLKSPESVKFTGYEISPQAYELCTKRSNARLCFKLKNYCDEADNSCDLLLLIDLIEHLEDYFRFLRDVREKASIKYFIFLLKCLFLRYFISLSCLGRGKKSGICIFFQRKWHSRY